MYMDENTGLYVTRRRVNTYTYMCRVFREESTIIRETFLRLNYINITKRTYSYQKLDVYGYNGERILKNECC